MRAFTDQSMEARSGAAASAFAPNRNIEAKNEIGNTLLRILSSPSQSRNSPIIWPVGSLYSQESVSLKSLDTPCGEAVPRRFGLNINVVAFQF